MRERILEQGPGFRRALLLVGIVGTPVLFLRFTNEPFNVPKLSLLIAVTALVGGLRLIEITQGASWRGLERLSIPVAALLIPLTVSWAFSPYRGWALLGHYPRFQGLIPYVVLAVFGILIADAFAQHRATLALAVLSAGAIVGGYTVLQFAGMDPFRWGLYGAPTEAVSTTGNPNFTGGFLGIVLPLGAGLALSDRERRATAAKLLVPIVLGWLLARSEGGWAAGAAGMAVVAGFVLAPRVQGARLIGILVPAGMAIGVAGAVVYATLAPDSALSATWLVHRGRWWQAAMGMMSQSPLVGTGPNTFAIEGIAHRPLADALAFGYDFPDDPHSVYASMLANAGLLGGLGFLAVFAWAAVRGLAVRTDDILGAAFLGAVGAYFVQAVVSIDEPTLRVVLWAALAGLAVSSGSEMPVLQRRDRKRPAKAPRRTSRSVSRRASSMRRWPVVAVSATVALALVVWSGLFLFADARVRQARISFRHGRLDEAASRFDQAFSLYPNPVYRGYAAFLFKQIALDAEYGDQEYFRRSRAAFGYVDRVPFVFSIVNYGQLLDLWGEEEGSDHDDEALGQFRRAFAIDPANPMNRVELADVLIELGREGDASAVLEPAAEMVGDGFPRFWGTLALARAQQGRWDAARQALDIALQGEPGNENALRAQELIEDHAAT